MKRRIKGLQASSLVLALTCSLLLPTSLPAETAGKEDAGLPLAELRVFAEIFGRIKTSYVEPVDDRTLLENAIRGMVSSLDPHSSYLNTEEFQDIQVGTKGEFGGLGIEVGMEDGFVKVVSPIDDTPAQRAGVQAGDLIIRLDDTPVKGMNLNDAVKLMRGKPGTEITLTISREKEPKPLRISVVRDVIKVTSVKSRLLEDHYAYVRISQFQSRSATDLESALKKLQEKSKNSLQGLILDLRNNPGGILNAAVAISDAFMDKGLIVYTKGRIDDSDMRFEASPGDLLKGAPIVVLVNEGSASASEIVAGALQDSKRAVIMGKQTFGKGSVQTIIPINENEAIKLTTALYYTPSGRSIQAEGIKPDIKLEDVKVSKDEEDDVKPLKEAHLSGHLENAMEKSAPSKDSKTMTDAPDELATEDYQLGEALNLLKGMVIVHQFMTK